MSEISLLLDRRDVLLRELRALENKVAGIDMAIRILAECGNDASAMSGSAQARNGLGPKGASAVPEGETPNE
jgi:hypothetical protein